MLIRFARAGRLLAVLALVSLATRASAQTFIGYGVTANGSLFRFDPASPAVATPIGNMGIVPGDIDFRPTTTPGDPNRTLYALVVGSPNTQLYAVNTTTAAVTPVGPGFPSSVAGSYNLTDQFIDIDFNPTTLQGNGSILMRVIGSSGVNMRINSDTGVVVAVDTPLQYPPSSSPFADGLAYINSNKATGGGTTVLFDMDARPDQTSIQNPPNAGTLNVVGPFGVAIDANPGLAFDVISDPNDADPTIGGDHAFAALSRNEGPTSATGYLLYDVNLATGGISNGRAVGGGLDFTGGLALTYGVPEPTGLVLVLLGGLLMLNRRHRSEAK
jgi:hypothetical protein